MKRTLSLLLIVLILVSIIIPTRAAGASGDSQTVIPFTTYLQNKYYSANETYRNDGVTVGTLMCEGATYSGKRVGGVDMYVAEGNVNIALYYSVSQMQNPYLDHLTVVDGLDLGASVHRGAVTVLTKSERDAQYVHLYTACDVLNTHANGVESVYVPASDDILQGLWVKILFAFSTCGGGGSVKRQLQVAEFYLIAKSEALVFDLSAENDGVLSTNGACTTSGFEIVLPRATRMFVSYNGSAFTPTTKTVFQTPGRYELLFQAPDGTQTQKRIYILPPREEALRSYFAASGIVKESTRIFTTSELPTYEMGAWITWEQPNTLPPLLEGDLTNLDSGDTVEIQIEDGLLVVPAGRWRVTFQNGSDGSFYLFEQSFEVLQTAPESTVNEYFLNEWRELGNDARNWRPLNVTLQCDQMMVATNHADGSVTELLFGKRLGEQLSPGIYTVRELAKNGKTATYTLDLTESHPDAYTDPQADRSMLITTVAITAAIVLAIVLIPCLIGYLRKKRRKHECSNND